MNRFIIITLYILISTLCFAQQDTSNLVYWKSHTIPTNSDTLVKYNWSKLEWNVFKSNGQVYAKLAGKMPFEKLPFRINPMDEKEKHDMEGYRAFLEVDDGYLVSFWRGEFGGNLYWFDKKGEKRQPIYRALISQFIKRENKIYAIAGLDHMGLSMGGIIEIRKENSNWSLSNYLNLNNAPYAIEIDKKDNFIVITSDNLLSIDTNKRIDTLISKGFWNALYPTSIVVSNNIVFIGMRQGVFKFNLSTHNKDWLMRD